MKVHKWMLGEPASAWLANMAAKSDAQLEAASKRAAAVWAKWREKTCAARETLRLLDRKERAALGKYKAISQLIETREKERGF